MTLRGCQGYIHFASDVDQLQPFNVAKLEYASCSRGQSSQYRVEPIERFAGDCVVARRILDKLRKVAGCG